MKRKTTVPSSTEGNKYIRGSLFLTIRFYQFKKLTYWFSLIFLFIISAIITYSFLIKFNKRKGIW
ncbi:MAG: hypothetical protein B6D44_16350 [Ignavibacteriales bacterium UTCHB2]|nr:MAG: hypothetical protein B6D44_16350 [Ignavibacteriales bacterium UTCHB2]